MEISVIVTNFNYGRFLGRCLRSLLAQTLDRSRYEVIVVDDGSTDDSMEIVRSFEGDVKIIALDENMGLSYASNIGIKASKTRYVVRVDSDDYVHSNFLETLLLGFELLGFNCEAISCDYVEVDEVGQIIGYKSSISDPIACGLAFKIDALESLGFYNDKIKIFEEIDLIERFLRAGYRINNVSLPLYRYVKHSNSLTSRVIK